MEVAKSRVYLNLVFFAGKTCWINNVRDCWAEVCVA